MKDFRALTEHLRPHIEALEISVLNGDEKAAAVINLYQAVKNSRSDEMRSAASSECEQALTSWKAGLTK